VGPAELFEVDENREEFRVLKTKNGLVTNLLAVFAGDVRMAVDDCIWQREADC